MPGIFKGLERNEEGGELVARIGYPDARTFTPVLQDGRIVMTATHTPREVTMNETEFSGKFGVGFNELGGLPFKEDGYPLNQIARAAPQADKPAPAAPKPTTISI